MRRGISTGGDFLATTLDGISLDTIWREFLATLAIWNNERSAVANLFTTTTTQTGLSLAQTEEGEDFEEASEFGKPKAQRAEVEPFVMGLPLKWYDSAVRYTERFLRDATSAQVTAQHSSALNADNRLVFKLIMQALFAKPSVANRAVNENGATIYPLWDGEADAKPPVWAGREFAPGHNHFLTTGGTALTGAKLAEMVGTITEHGYGTKGNDKIVVIMHPDEGEVARSFRVADGDPFDFIPSSSAPAYLTSEQIVGEKPPASVNGLPVFGSFGKALLVEDYYMPTKYLAATATGAAPLAIRQHVRREYQGLRIIPGQGHHPMIDSTYQHGLGVGVQRRGAAAVMKVTGGSYTEPTF